MSASVCLPPLLVDKFKQAVISGKINPEKLSKMTSEQRHALFSEHVGEANAKWVNSLFESKTLLKNQQAGMIRWAQKVAGATPEVRRDLISRIQKMDRVLNPTEEKAFLKDLAETKLGFGVSVKEAKQIANMSSKLQELEATRKPNGSFPDENTRMQYGRTKVAMGAYLADLKNQAERLTVKQNLTQHPFTSAAKVSGLAKSLKATLDNSAIFRQGWKTMWTNPGIWQRNARKSFIDIAKQLGGKETLKEVQADIVSRPNAALYDKMKLAIGNVEEEFPSQLPEKIPGLRRLYRASEGAYTGFLYRQRADIADQMLHIAQKTGVDITNKKELESIGKLINSLTGRGNLGRFEGTAANTLNSVFFSVRFLKSNIDTLTAHQLQHGVTPFVRKRAALNLVKIVAGTAAIMGIANAVRPGSAELDPRSTNFGKIKVGNTTFDITGGQGSIAVLAARLAPLLIGKDSYIKNSKGSLSKLNSGITGTSGMDVFNQFFENKLAPAATVVKDMLNQQDFNGNRPTVTNELKNTFVPFPISNATQKSDPHGANKLLIGIADGLGIAASTNTPSKNLSTNLTKSDQGLRDKIGNDRFQQYNDQYNTKLNNFTNGSFYQSLPPDKKQAALTQATSKIKANLYKHYGYKAPKATTDKAFNSAISNAVK